MRAQEVIKTIYWLESLLEGTRFFSEPPRGGEQNKNTAALIMQFSKALYRLGKILPIIEGNAAAIKVLAAFDLSELLTEEMGERLINEIIEPATPDIVSEMHRKLFYQWRDMIKFVEPLSTLTTPTELRKKEESEDIFSLQLRRAEGRELPLDELTKAMTYMQKLYDDLANIYEKEEAGRLSLVKIESGSTVEINAKGSGEVVKELRKWFMEAWRMLRSRKPDKVVAHTEAILNSLDALERIDNANISDEEKTRMRRSLVGNTVKLLRLGVLPAEVEDQESINNVDLLDGYAQKLLPAPAEISESQLSNEKTGEKKVKAKRKKARRKK